MADKVVAPFRQHTYHFEDASLAVSLADGEAAIVSAAGMVKLTMIPGSGATITYSKVNGPEVDSHDSDTSTNISSETSIDVAWPYYRVSTAGGSARVGLV